MLTSKTLKEQREEIKRQLVAWGTALKDCERRRAEIRDLKKQMDEMEDMLRGQMFDDMPRGTGVGNSTARALEIKERTAQRIAELLEEINRIMEGKARMDAMIATLPEHLRELLEMHYVKSWRMTSTIPIKLHIATSTAYDWRDEAVEKIMNLERSETFGKNL